MRGGILLREEVSWGRGGSHSTGGPTGQRRVCLQVWPHHAASPLLPSPLAMQLSLDLCNGFGHVLTQESQEEARLILLSQGYPYNPLETLLSADNTKTFCALDWTCLKLGFPPFWMLGC